MWRTGGAVAVLAIVVGACSSRSSGTSVATTCPESGLPEQGACGVSGLTCSLTIGCTNEFAYCVEGSWQFGGGDDLCAADAAIFPRDAATEVGADAGNAADAAVDADAESGADCTPKTCAYPAGTCGQQNDGCGGLTANCGTCTPPAFCGGGGPGLCGGGGAPVLCYPDICVPQTCADFDCGQAGDGCGDVLDCGPCPSSEACVNNQCIWPADAGLCVPATCEGLAYDCGVPSDGCGGHLECGTCPVSQFCGGGGVHRCGGVCDMPDGAPCEVTCSSDAGGSCTGQSCQGSGATCGEAPNGCGGLIDCGPCGADAGTSDAPAGG
jgi:hypothetical protein